MNFEPQVGDVILVSSRGILAWTNRLLQNLLKARFTHALVAIDNMLAVHSLPIKGVQITGIWDELTHKNVNEWKVLRNTEIAGYENQAASENFDTLVKNFKSKSYRSIENMLKPSGNPTVFGEAIENADKKYNSLFYLSRLFRNYRANHVFCTQLIDGIFKKIGFPISKKKSDRVFPKDIENLKETDGWNDVTADYKQVYERYLKDKNNLLIFQAITRSRINVIKATDKVNRRSEEILKKQKDIEERREKNL